MLPMLEGSASRVWEGGEKKSEGGKKKTEGGKPKSEGGNPMNGRARVEKKR